MRNLFICLLVGLTVPAIAQKPTLENLKDSILLKLKSVEGVFGVAFKDLQTNQTLLINEKENFHGQVP
jgi:beta-lactamase class A